MGSKNKGKVYNLVLYSWVWWYNVTNGMLISLMTGLLGCNSPDPARDNGAQRIDATPMSSAETLAHLCGGKDVSITVSYGDSSTGYLKTYSSFTGEQDFGRPIIFQWNPSSGYEITTQNYHSKLDCLPPTSCTEPYNSGTIVYTDRDGTSVDMFSVKNEKNSIIHTYDFTRQDTCNPTLPWLRAEGATCKERKRVTTDYLASVYDSLVVSVADKKAGKEQEGVHLKYFCEM